jgi:hypothetical protein
MLNLLMSPEREQLSSVITIPLLNTHQIVPLHLMVPAVSWLRDNAVAKPTMIASVTPISLVVFFLLELSLVSVIVVPLFLLEVVQTMLITTSAELVILVSLPILPMDLLW